MGNKNTNVKITFIILVLPLSSGSVLVWTWIQASDSHRGWAAWRDPRPLQALPSLHLASASPQWGKLHLHERAIVALCCVAKLISKGSSCHEPLGSLFSGHELDLNMLLPELSLAFWSSFLG